jgi:hypothetical protein
MENKQAIDAALVQEFVLNAHANLERVQELLDQEPGLLNAAHDWGAGDWETALGAAAHMGRRDIATLLLERGARIDLFAAAMLGCLEIVRATLQTFPEMRHALGAHGIPLIVHAQAGGAEAEAVVGFLQESITGTLTPAAK